MSDATVDPRADDVLISITSAIQIYVDKVENGVVYCDIFSANGETTTREEMSIEEWREKIAHGMWIAYHINYGE